MDIKQKYREETNLDIYSETNIMTGGTGCFSNEYVKWLEEQLRLCGVNQQSELLNFFADEWNENQTTAETVIMSQDINECIEKFNCG